jgi:hypothetical protein
MYGEDIAASGVVQCNSAVQQRSSRFSTAYSVKWTSVLLLMSKRSVRAFAKVW